MRQTVLAFFLMLSFGAAAGTAHADGRCPFPRGVVCDGQFLSWVKVSFFNDATNDALDQTAESYTAKVRAYLRREIPELKHEIVDPRGSDNDGPMNIFRIDPSKAKEKVIAECMIAAARSGPSSGMYVECGLLTFLDARDGNAQSVTSAAMAASTNLDDHDDLAVRMLRKVAKQLSDRFYSKLSRYESLASD